MFGKTIVVFSTKDEILLVVSGGRKGFERVGVFVVRLEALACLYLTKYSFSVKLEWERSRCHPWEQ